MTDQSLILTLAGAYFATLISGGWLLWDEHHKLEWYRAQYYDAQIIIESQSTSLDGAEISLAIANGVIDQCTAIVSNHKSLHEASQ